MYKKINLGIYISKIKQIHDRILNHILSKREITVFNGERGKILHILWEKDNITCKELSEKTGLAINTLTPMLDRIEKVGLIERRPHPGDRRKVLIKLTEYAQGFKKEYEEISETMANYVYEGFSQEEIEMSEGFLERISQNLEKVEKERSKK
ncbi:MarR family winged helix-turn-helix transcriptional regulator [Leptotrichia sp. oral taxon 223]|uniref:MarR family winged helix-turn-helix transcriptional regulator n=1 Tax=Leptotrichia sp. oral taxon 223 TaxID=712363 RepID=UPI0015BDE1A9|nr:MarR family transcriptional regulator [Leptotrichia sp. oral taxon 223]NWO20086.1 MarR family transcriptional regulator [Leptotrichia sp. oral taxon 223]